MNIADVFEVHRRYWFAFGIAHYRRASGDEVYKTKPIYKLNILMGMVLVSIMYSAALVIKPAVAVYFYIETKVTPEDAGPVYNNCRLIALTFSLASYIVIIVFCACKTKPQMSIVRRFFHLDRKIQSIFKVDFKYEEYESYYRFYAIAMVTYIFTGIQLLLTYFALMENYLIDNTSVLMYGFNLLYAPQITFHYGMLCEMITFRFKILRDLFKSPLTNTQFKILIEVNQGVRKCVEDLNDGFGVIQLFNLLNDAMVITVWIFFMLFALFASRGEKFHYFSIFGCLFFVPIYTAKLFYTCFKGECLKNQIPETNKAIWNNANSKFMGREKQILFGCPLDRLYGFELKCTAAQFFNIDNSLILKMFSTIVTHLVIFLQFQLKQES